MVTRSVGNALIGGCVTAVVVGVLADGTGDRWVPGRTC